MKKLAILLLSLTLLVTFAPNTTLAATLENLPSTESSKQWEVIVDNADSDDPNFNKSTKPDLYNVYSMDIKNIGDENVKSLRIEAYRNDPNLKTEYELFTAEDEENKLLTPSFHHNFPLSSKATNLKVFITWTKKSRNNIYQRKYREVFVFQ
jgi:hypothetical protein